MNVARQFLQVNIRVNQDRLVPPLEQMTRPVLAPIHPLRIAKAQILKNSRKRDVPYLDRQVNMIAHETEGVDAMTE